MKYRLGRFRLVEQHIQVLIERLTRAGLARSTRDRRDDSRTAARDYLSVLRSRMEDTRRRREPDLFESLEPDHPDRPWLRQVHDELARHGQRVRLQVCEHEPGDDGYTALAAHVVDGGRKVRKGDEILAGFAALRDGGSALRIWPRTYRVVCTNGAMVTSGAAEDVLETSDGVADAVRHSLSGEVLAAACVTYRLGGEVAVSHPRAFLAAVSGRALEPEDAHEVMREWQRSGDRTLWGLVNAVTATARDRDDARDRFLMEDFGGRLACLAATPRALPWQARRPRPERTAAPELAVAELGSTLL